MTIEGAETRPSPKKPSIGQFFGRIFFPHGKDNEVAQTPTEQAITPATVSSKLLRLQHELTINHQVNPISPDSATQVRKALSFTEVRFNPEDTLTASCTIQTATGKVILSVRENRLTAEGALEPDPDSAFDRISVRLARDASTNEPRSEIETIIVVDKNGASRSKEGYELKDPNARLRLIDTLVEAAHPSAQPKA